MMFDPTPEQVEDAYQAWLNFPRKRGPQNAVKAIRAALVAAAGATPQETRERQQRVVEAQRAVFAEIHGQPVGRTYSVAEVKKLVYRLDNAIADALAAPVQVDEAKLSEVLARVYDEGSVEAPADYALQYEEAMQYGRDGARAVAERLRGGER